MLRTSLHTLPPSEELWKGHVCSATGQISCFLVFLFCYSVCFSSIILSEISRNGAREERNKPFQAPTKKDFVFFFFLALWKHQNQMVQIHSCPLQGQRQDCPLLPPAVVSQQVCGAPRPLELLRPSPARPVESRGGALPAWPGGLPQHPPFQGFWKGQPVSQQMCSEDKGPHVLLKPGH